MTKVLTILFIDVIFFILLCFTLIMPQLKSLHFLQAKEKMLKQNYALTYSKVQQLTLLKQQLDKLDKINNKTKAFIFKRQSIVVHAIADTAKQFNVQVEAIRFKEKYRIGELCLHPVLVDLAGDYGNLQAFATVLLGQFLFKELQLTKKQNNYFGSFNLVLIS